MDDRRKEWLAERELLRQTLEDPAERERALALFLHQHAMVHAARMSETGLYSFEDEVLGGLPDSAYCRVPPGAEHSIAWTIWHITRCEDITMNMLVAGCPQVLADGWAEKINTTALDTGNSMDAAAAAAFSAPVIANALLDYRVAVGRRTREIVQRLPAGDFQRKVAAARIAEVAEQGAVDPGSGWLLDYWGGRTVAGLLLMPATRHQLSHLNEAARLRKKLKI